MRGLEVLIFFSSAIAIDCASKPPITIGNFLLPLTSSKINAKAPEVLSLYEIP